MAKSDTFFIRGSANFDNTGFTFQQSEIDLGSYVNALAKTILKVHSVSVQYGNPTQVPTGTGPFNTKCSFQLTTQSQTGAVTLTDRSVVSSGKLAVGFGAANELTVLAEDMDVGPQYWQDGYLIATEQIYLGVQTGADIGLTGVQIVLECSVETMTQSAAMALALSQQ
ncbi:unnamed protein product [marine sediment metagenome]|uniref:Uncharacterized protein n=1 Tax=marine sediment metagenome TaxID=412755 RepID=X0YR66_9ZZZZ